MTIEMLQNARNWATKHQKFASGWARGWGSAPDPAGGLCLPDPLKRPPLLKFLGTTLDEMLASLLVLGV